jgi:hypothetical protein
VDPLHHRTPVPPPAVQEKEKWAEASAAGRSRSVNSNPAGGVDKKIRRV